MKALFTTLFLTLTLLGNSQVSSDTLNKIDKTKNCAPTTMTEYRYVTLGFLDDMQMGKDVKEGYKARALGYWSTNYGALREGYMYCFVRDGETQPCAIGLLLYRKDTNNKTMICIPTADAPSEVWQAAISNMEVKYPATNVTTATFYNVQSIMMHVVARISDLASWEYCD